MRVADVELGLGGVRSGKSSCALELAEAIEQEAADGRCVPVKRASV